MWSIETGAFGDSAAITGTATNNLRFPGQYADGESGLSYNWNRYYDSSVGRYISSDSIGLLGGVNTFAYVQNNTLSSIDRDGQIPVQVVTGIIGFAMGGGSSVVMQLAQNGGDIHSIKWTNVAVAAATGAFAGALAPWSLTTGRAIALGSGSNVAQYYGTQFVNGDSATVSGAVLSGIAGAVAGGIGGKFTAADGLRFMENSPWLSSVLAKTLNRDATVVKVTAWRELLRQFFSGLIGQTELDDAFKKLLNDADAKCP